MHLPRPPSFHARIGMGLLRIDPSIEAHRHALAHAVHSGIRDFDLGYAQDPLWRERARAVASAIVERTSLKPEQSLSKNTHFRVFSRGGLAEAPGPFLLELSKIFSGAPSIELAYFISDPESTLRELQGDYAEFDARLRAQCLLLEKLCEDGILSFYGVGSTAFTLPKDDPQYLSIAQLVAAEGAAPLPHFRAIELPLNLYETAAARFKNQAFATPADDRSEEGSTPDESCLVVCRSLGLEVYARRPFDAITEAQLLRLVAYPNHHRLNLDDAVMRTLEVAVEKESALLASSENLTLPYPLHWAHRLRRQLPQVNDPEQWKEIYRRRILPEVEALRSAAFAIEESADYFQSLDALFLAIRMWFEKSAAERNERLRAKIVEAVPALRTNLGISNTALRIYRSLPGLSCIFIGLRTEKYIDEAQSVVEPLPEEDAALALSAAEGAISDYLSNRGIL